MRNQRPITTVVAGLLVAGLMFVSCGKKPTKPPPLSASDVILTIDGIDITLGDVEPIVQFIREVNPEGGRKTITQAVLEKYLVPLRLAERAFADERRKLHSEAADLRSVATNVLELERQEANLRVKERKKFTRLQPDLPVAKFLFDPLMRGAVSDPIAVPRGFVIAAVHDYTETPVASEDMAEATRVGFYTHTVNEWHTWIAAEQARVADKITYVHPDYRDALPTWCKLK